MEDNPDFGVDAVKIEAADPENPLLVAAAANVVRTINIVLAALTAANQSQEVQVGEKVMTVGQLRNFLSKSKFTVTDRPFSNGGYGSASPNGAGGGTFEWNYKAFDGDPLNSGSMDYAHPNYSKKAGMNDLLTT
ncbi:hypothetical protein NYR55_04640 [Sphingomonas sp. BGYR3]|uniref:hypothetical protein n=1 Tax=Sphingomonas sp. BGYR3 TaxID=2975483 RepID=UPI0021A411C7|nr:hypothetical protein [Sphingomonas sp. BGYR3]MDG5487905.1 hypothetical protein [Sphingomonas sp. BGYR3]